jgi:hypothetical protein
MSRPDDGSQVRCQARIWPSSWSGWGQCPGRVMPDGNCSAYGSQHRADPRTAAPAAEADDYRHSAPGTFDDGARRAHYAIARRIHNTVAGDA